MKKLKRFLAGSLSAVLLWPGTILSPLIINASGQDPAIHGILQDHTVTTYDPEGLRINLFDYHVKDVWNGFDVIVPELSGNDSNQGYLSEAELEMGINKDHILKFQHGHSSGKWNSDTKGIVKPLLENGFPVVCPDEKGRSESLDYLFDPEYSNNLGGSVDIYENAKGLFQLDELGNYTFDSKKNYAWLDPQQQTDATGNSYYQFEVYDKPAIAVNASRPGEFFPFTDPSAYYTYQSKTYSPIFNERNGDLYDTGSSGWSSTSVNHWNGLTMEIPFQQPVNGYINTGLETKIPMTFNFEGDDDVWIFVDDVLVLDLGGLHSPVQGTIDFNSGAINERGTQTTLYDKFVSANAPLDKFKSLQSGSDKPIFRDNTNHTIKIFYLERAWEASNLTMTFNLQPILADSLKKVDENGAGISNVSFDLYEAEKSASFKEGNAWHDSEEFTPKNILVSGLKTGADGFSYLLKNGDPLDIYEDQKYYLLREETPAGFRTNPDIVLQYYSSQSENTTGEDTGTLKVINKYETGAYASFYAQLTQKAADINKQKYTSGASAENQFSPGVQTDLNTLKNGLVIVVPLLKQTDESDQFQAWLPLYGSNSLGWYTENTNTGNSPGSESTLVKDALLAALRQLSEPGTPNWYMSWSVFDMLTISMEDLPGDATRYLCDNVGHKEDADLHMLSLFISDEELKALGVSAQSIPNNSSIPNDRIANARFEALTKLLKSQSNIDGFLNKVESHLSQAEAGQDSDDLFFLDIDSFNRSYRSMIYIPNERRELRVQKINSESGKPVEGAVFALFTTEEAAASFDPESIDGVSDADQFFTKVNSQKNQYNISAIGMTANGIEVASTATGKSVKQDGMLVFSPNRGTAPGNAYMRWPSSQVLTSSSEKDNGTYWLREIYAPKGYQTGFTIQDEETGTDLERVIRVEVGNVSIYANATAYIITEDPDTGRKSLEYSKTNDENDGVSVTAYLGKLDQTLAQYAMGNKVDITLEDLNLREELAPGYEDGGLSKLADGSFEWTGSGATVDVHYGMNEDQLVGRYGRHHASDDLPVFTVEDGYVRIMPTQNLNPENSEGIIHDRTTKKDILTDNGSKNGNPIELYPLFTLINVVNFSDQPLEPEKTMTKIKYSSVEEGQNSDFTNPQLNTLGYYPTVRNGDEITYEISWTNTGIRGQKVIITDYLDDGFDLVSATPDETKSNFVQTVEEGRKKVTWTFTTQSGDTNSQSVFITVRVNGAAFDTVSNQAVIQYENGKEFETQLLENLVASGPVKKETEINGKEISNIENPDEQSDQVLTYPDVYDEDLITYQIAWLNDGESDQFEITDQLNESLELMTASFEWAETSESVELKNTDTDLSRISISKTFTTSEEKGITVDINYDKVNKTITWHFSNIPINTDRYSVSLIASVNGKVTPEDRILENRASVKTGTKKAQQTNTVENYISETLLIEVKPEETPVKSITQIKTSDNRLISDPESGETNTLVDTSIAKGDEITYEISFTNYNHSEISILDQLQEYFDYISSDRGGFYNPETREVSWTITSSDESPESDSVHVTVGLNEKAAQLDSVENGAKVIYISSDPDNGNETLQTNVVESAVFWQETEQPDPTDPEDPEKPEEPDPTDPNEPTEPDNPTDPEDPDNQEDPDDPKPPAEPDVPNPVTSENYIPLQIQKYHKIEGSTERYDTDDLETVFGEEISYLVKVKNISQDTTVENIQVLDVIPTFYDYEYSKIEGSITPINGDSLIWNVGTLEPGEEDYIILPVVIEDRAPGNETAVYGVSYSHIINAQVVRNEEEPEEEISIDNDESDPEDQENSEEAAQAEEDTDDQEISSENETGSDEPASGLPAQEEQSADSYDSAVEVSALVEGHTDGFDPNDPSLVDLYTGSIQTLYHLNFLEHNGIDGLFRDADGDAIYYYDDSNNSFDSAYSGLYSICLVEYVHTAAVDPGTEPDIPYAIDNPEPEIPEIPQVPEPDDPVDPGEDEPAIPETEPEPEPSTPSLNNGSYQSPVQETENVPAAQPTLSVPEVFIKEHYAYIIGRNYQYAAPNEPIAREEVVTIFFRLLTDEARNRYWSTVQNYPDVASDLWCNNAIATMSRMGIVQGYSDGLFRPNQSMTRAELAKVAVSFFNELNVNSYSAVTSFTDTAGHWAHNYIEAAKAFGLIQGYGDNSFRPDAPITRAEAMSIINRLIGRKPHIEGLYDESWQITWPDNQDKNEWYYAIVQEATNSHTQSMDLNVDGQVYENWKQPLEVRDWAAFEKMWADANASKNPGNVLQ